jgi:hypothetical protein
VIRFAPRQGASLQNGVVNQSSAGKFAPSRAVHRAEIAAGGKDVGQ